MSRALKSHLRFNGADKKYLRKVQLELTREKAKAKKRRQGEVADKAKMGMKEKNKNVQTRLKSPQEIDSEIERFVGYMRELGYDPQKMDSELIESKSRILFEKYNNDTKAAGFALSKYLKRHKTDDVEAAIAARTEFNRQTGWRRRRNELKNEKLSEKQDESLTGSSSASTVSHLGPAISPPRIGNDEEVYKLDPEPWWNNYSFE